MTQLNITKRQQQWLDHILAAAANDGSIVEYAKANNLKTKDIYQWKTLLTKRGFLPVQSNPESVDFVPLHKTSDTAPLSATDASCRITLPCGSVFELFSPITAELPRLLAAFQSGQ
ncbi:MAG: hypothetical protein V3U65_03405 [Granulosicoccaceae bacterium]